MVDSRVAELIQADLDGDLNGPERAELGRALLADPDARRLHASLERTDAALKAMRDVDPPPELRDRILDSIFPRSEATPPAPVVPGRGAGPLRYAAVFAGGLLMASMAFYLSGPDTTSISRDDIAGTMAGGGSYGELAGEAMLGAGAAKAAVRLYRSGAVTVLEARVKDGPGAVLEVTYDPESLRLTGIVPGAETDVRAGPGQLLVAAQEAPRRLYFDSSEASGVQFDIALRSASGEREEETLIVPAGR